MIEKFYFKYSLFLIFAFLFLSCEEIAVDDLLSEFSDDNIPVTVQIRTMRDGTPKTTIVPFGEMNIDPSDIIFSDDSTLHTPFKFPTPVYLKSGKEYALTLVAPTEKYNHFITRMGEEDLILQAISNQQPSMHNKPA